MLGPGMAADVVVALEEVEIDEAALVAVSPQVGGSGEAGDAAAHHSHPHSG